MKWFFPNTLSEVNNLLKDGYKAHGGGTFLVKTSLNIAGLFDLSGISELKDAQTSRESIILGSALSYAEAAEIIETASTGNFISKALSSAASCPLRNRITLGGSIYAAPKWSDLIGPLFAADASLKLSSVEDSVPIADYHSDRKLKHSGIITEIIIPKTNISGNYYRFTQTHFDYPFFTISISIRGKDDFSCCLTGSAGGLFEFSGNSADLTGVAFPKFNKERGFSGEYIRHRAEIEFIRLLKRSGGNINE